MFDQAVDAATALGYIAIGFATEQALAWTWSRVRDWVRQLRARRLRKESE